MRIEFSTEHESSETLAMIIDICERQIHSNQRRVADLNERIARESGGTLRLAGGDAAAAAMCERVALANLEGDNRVMNQREPPTPPGFGKTNNGAPLGINEKTGEFDNDLVAARKAFGGGAVNPTVLETAPPAPPAATGSAPPATGISATGATLPPAPPATLERDAKNIPYDARIHSKEKTKNGDGTWRYKRKLDEAVKTAVLAEIVGTRSPVQPPAGAMPPPPPPPTGALPPPPPGSPVSLPLPPPSGGVGGPGTAPMGRPGVPLPPPNGGVPHTNQQNVVPIVNPTSAPRVPSGANGSGIASSTGSTAPVGASPSNMTFQQLVAALNVSLSSGRVTQDSLQSACADLAIPSPGALASPDYAHLIDALYAKLFPEG